MSHNIILGEYYPVLSKIHKMNPVVKILSILLLIFSIFCIHSWRICLCLFLFTLLIVLLTNIPFRYYIKIIKFVFPLFIFLFIIGFCLQNTFLETLLVSLKMALIVLYVIMLLATTTSAKLTYAFQILLSPLKIFQIDVFALTTRIPFYLRWFSQIEQEKNRILDSAMSRGYKNDICNIKEKIMILKQAKISVQQKVIGSAILDKGNTSIFDFYFLALCVCIVLFVLKKEIIG